MPTADEFDQAAQWYSTAADRLPALMTSVESSREAIRGGRLHWTLRNLIAEGASLVARWQDTLWHAAETCHSRAATIRAIEDALRQFHLEQAGYEVAMLSYQQQGESTDGQTSLARPVAPAAPNVYPLPAWADLVVPMSGLR